ncbi:alpha/beta hydrolase [Devosia sp. MC521]|uniref:alpha/beta hydrolase n=1 Tax=Devosia sp. MC521 TaxID=2759954 RepID=UPI0015F98F48|nr:alpha/beta hydrolase [Devosia sp. MC521]MBJ6987175.1 alpha/beta hydrolase [Devosia sp. MC521]QMW62789.1 alpha/beta hydrolase [Devosia sp. MC521]
MSSLNKRIITLGNGSEAREIASLQRDGHGPGLFWINGFRSVMTGDKATALDAFGAEKGLSVTRFDHAGIGDSPGDFNAGTISRWLEEAEAAFSSTTGPQIVVGSSMGGWLALLLARKHLVEGKPLKGLVLIAPAVDATEVLIPARLNPEERALILTQGYYDHVSAYGDGSYRYTRELLEDGRNHLLLGNVIETGCPVHILQGGLDTDVPRQHVEKLLTHILHDPVTFSLIPDGDHRLSRPQDLALLRAALEPMIAS